MKYIFFLLLLGRGSISLASLPWSQDVLKTYNSAKSYQDLFCTNAIESEQKKRCSYFQKELGSVWTQKPVAISSSDSSLLQIHLAPSKTIRLERAGKPSRYTVNGHEVDLLDFDSSEDLHRSLKAFLPRPSRQSSYFWWESVGWAEPDLDPQDKQAVAAIEYLITQTDHVEGCQAIENYVKTCIDKSSYLDQAIIKTHQAWQSADSDLREKQSAIAIRYAHLLGKMGDAINRRKTVFGPKMIKACGVELHDDFLPTDFAACKSTLASYKKAMLVMGQDMDMEKIEEPINSISGGDPKPKSSADPIVKKRSGNQ